MKKHTPDESHVVRMALLQVAHNSDCPIIRGQPIRWLVVRSCYECWTADGPCWDTRLGYLRSGTASHLRLFAYDGCSWVWSRSPHRPVMG